MASSRPRLLDWRSGGGLLLASGILVLAVVGWRVIPLLRQPGHALGGEHAADYGFDLTTAVIPIERIVPSGLPRDGIPALDAPAKMRVEEVETFNEEHRGKYLVSSDRVIGVAIGDEARAYPIRVMNWHEVVNDTIGGVPVAVTFSPLCDSVVVFDRRVDGKIVEFGVSGLLYNSNLLMHDRAGGLWSQLQSRAIAGPAAVEGGRLTVLPASLTRWDHWIDRHPQTTVVRPDPLRFERYRRNPYGSYLATGKLRFPVEPLPPGDPKELMHPILAVEGPAPELFRLDRRDGLEGLQHAAPGYSITVVAAEPTPSILVSADSPGTVYSRWFAWYAQHPDRP